MEKQIISWITDYQNTGDEAVLRQVREVCWPIVEAVLQEKAIDDEQANNLREKESSGFHSSSANTKRMCSFRLRHFYEIRIGFTFIR